MASILICTLLNWHFFKKTSEANLVMIYLLGLIPVAVQGNRGAALLTAFLAVACFDFFFVPPYFTFSVADVQYLFTFLVMGVVGVVVSTITAHLTASVSTLERAEIDLTRRTQALEQANEELKKLDRLKSNLINTVSHELRTPLTTIDGFVEFLEDQIGGPLTPAQREYVAQIHAGAARLEHLVDAMLDFARLDSGTFTLVRAETDLRGLIQEVVDAMRPRALEAQQTLQAALPDAPVTLHVDPKRISQALLNLLDNAFKFTRPGGRIDVALSQTATEVRIEVRDTGIGIAAEHLPQLFDKFYQVDASDTRAVGGAGLGLAITKALIEAHGGHVSVQSQVGRGSVFCLSLPSPKTETPSPEP